MFLEVLNYNVPASFLINYYLLRVGFRASQIVSITNFVVVSGVDVIRVTFLSAKFVSFYKMVQNRSDVFINLNEKTYD